MVRYGAHVPKVFHGNSFGFLLSVDRDGEFSSHRAHLCLLSKIICTRMAVMHTCFALPGLRAADVPFITLSRNGRYTPCFARPVTMPDADTVFGEYSVPSDIDTLTYPAGTVLIRPPSVVPCHINAQGMATPCDTLIFLVFKPCAAHLLRGAVPVGRVAYCGNNDVHCSPYDAVDGKPPFDTSRVSWFESLCAAGHCPAASCDKHLSLAF